MQASLVYVIKFVADMEKAITFYRDTLGLTLRFQSPHWSEFETGATTLALHPANAQNPAGTSQLGFRTPGLAEAYAAREATGLVFTQAPTPQRGVEIARIRDSEGAEISLSGA